MEKTIRFFVVCVTLGLLLALSGCGGDGSTAPSTSFPIGGGGTTIMPPAGAAVALTAIAGSGNGCITLAWSTTNLTSPTFDVVQTSGGSVSTLATGLSQTGYVVTGLTRSTTYRYQIVAHDGSGAQISSSTASATAFGPTTFGLGDPPSLTAGPDLVFSGGACTLVTSVSSIESSSNYFTVHITLNHTALAADLQSVQYQGMLYNATTTSGFSSGVSVSGNQLFFDSRKAGITLASQYRPVVRNGFYSLTMTVDNRSWEITAAAGSRNGVPIASSLTDSAGRTFSFSITNTP